MQWDIKFIQSNSRENSSNILIRFRELSDKDFDKRIRRTNRKLTAGDYVYVNITDGSRKLPKLAFGTAGPFRVLSNDKRTVLIDRDGVTERVSAEAVWTLLSHPL